MTGDATSALVRATRLRKRTLQPDPHNESLTVRDRVSLPHSMAPVCHCPPGCSSARIVGGTHD